MRVLVVDDNLTNLEILKLQLGGWGMQVSCAESGAQALIAMGEAVTAGAPFEIVILDMHMPGMDGLQLAHAIQADPALAGSRRVMLTSAYVAGDAQERERAGILRCVSKPIRQAELYDIVTRALMTGRGGMPAAPAAAGRLAPAPRKHLRGRVLLAEDNLVNQEVAKAMLADLGLRVEIANHGEEVLAMVATRDFDVVLMDCQMPVMDGYQATAALRQREVAGSRRLPVIALTANAMEGDRKQCLAAGMNDYLAKPYTRAQLEQVLSRWLAPDTRTDDTTPPVVSALPDAPVAVGQPAAIDSRILDQLRELDPSGGLGFAQHILQIYLDTSGDSVKEVEHAISAGDAEALRRTAHSLKSSSANVGATTLSGLFKQLEGLGREANLAGASALLDAMRQEYSRTTNEISALLTEAEAT